MFSYLQLEMNTSAVLSKEERFAFAIDKLSIKYKLHFPLQPLKP